MTVVPVYAPTVEASPGIKAKYMNELHYTTDRVPPGDILVVMRDFSAHVRKRETESDVCERSTRKTRAWKLQSSWRGILEFCAINNFTIMNTWFEKRQVYLVT